MTHTLVAKRADRKLEPCFICSIDADDSWTVEVQIATARFAVRHIHSECAANNGMNRQTKVEKIIEQACGPRVFIRQNTDPASGLAYETCLHCTKHIRHHFGGVEYRCDPKS